MPIKEHRALKELLGGAGGPPRTASGPLPKFRPGQRTNTPAAMLESLAAAKASAGRLDQVAQSLTRTAQSTKKRNARQTHQRDWMQTHAELHRVRSDAEASRTLWLQAEAEAASTSDGLPQLRELAREDEQSAAARREWSTEMRSQLQGLRELCAASKREPQQPAAAMELVEELSRSLDQTKARLAGAAEALERDLHALSQSIFSPDEEEDVVLAALEGETGGGGMASPLGEASASSSSPAAASLVTPADKRGPGEQKLLEVLGAGLRVEEEAHREALRSLRIEFFGNDDGGEEGRRADAEADQEAAEKENGAPSPAKASSPTQMGDYDVLPGPDDDEEPTPAAAAPASPAKSTSGGAASTNGEHARLVKLEREFRGRSRHQLLARLKLELPGVSADEIEARLEALNKRRAYGSRRRAMLLAWDARKHALARSAKHLLEELAASEGRLKLQREEREAMQLRRKELQKTLAVLEQVKAERDAEELAAKEAAKEAAEQLAEAQRVKFEAERAHKKALIAAYQQEQQENARKTALITLEEEAAKMAAKLAQAEYNLKRVQYRIELDERKKEMMREQREHLRLLGEEKMMRLERVTQAVVERMNLQADPYKPTYASTATRLANDELFPVYGYADETLMKDMRFKLGHALRNAGLNGTDYAREVLQKVGGAPSRPDAVVTNWQFGYDQ